MHALSWVQESHVQQEVTAFSGFFSLDMEDENSQDFENMRGDLDHHHLLGIWNKKTNKQGKFYMYLPYLQAYSK